MCTRVFWNSIATPVPMIGPYDISLTGDVTALYTAGSIGF